MAKSYRYGGTGLSTSFKWSNYSWAKGYTYVQPDYKKIREDIKQEQIKYNNMGIGLKVGYGAKVMVERKYLGLTKAEATQSSEVRHIVDFATKTEALGVVDLGIVDTFIMRMLYFGGSIYTTTDKKGNKIGPSQAMLNKENYELYRQFLSKKMEDAIKRAKLDEDKKGNHRGGVAPSQTTKLDENKVNKLKEEMLMRLTPPRDISQKEANLRKGKRINRNFIYGLSYKPLLQKETEKIKRKKVLNIVDGSGSMGKYQSDPIYVGGEFMYALSTTGLFDCTNFFSQEQTLSRGDDFYLHHNSGGEGFSQMPARLVDMGINVNDYDYVFVFTDCQIASKCKQELNEMLIKKKHILFCCKEHSAESMRSEYPALNIKTVQTTADMVNNLVSYV